MASPWHPLGHPWVAPAVRSAFENRCVELVGRITGEGGRG